MDSRGPREDGEEEQTGEVGTLQSRVKAKIKPILDLVRATPLGSGFLALNLGLLAKGVDLGYAPFIAMPVVGAAVSWRLASNQQRLRRRLEELYAQQGYSDRLFKATTREWCDRQVGRVVAANHGHLGDYVRLCEENKKDSSLTWLPHF